jgi:hypothetical protein
MKNAIAKFLGLDKIQTETTNLFNEVVSLRDRAKSLELDNAKLRNALSILEDTDWDSIARDNIDYSDIACSIDMYDLVNYLDMSDIAPYIETSDLAGYIDASDVASYIDTESVAEQIDYNALQDQLTDALDVDLLAETVSEKIADRDGMHQLISEEIENQGVGNISTDAVQSMIHTAIQQFADSLEVMVSAKLNINK